MSHPSVPNEPPTLDEALMAAARLLREAENSVPDLPRAEALREIAEGWTDIASLIQDRELHS